MSQPIDQSMYWSNDMEPSYDNFKDNYDNYVPIYDSRLNSDAVVPEFYPRPITTTTTCEFGGNEESIDGLIKNFRQSTPKEFSPTFHAFHNQSGTITVDVITTDKINPGLYYFQDFPCAGDHPAYEWGTLNCFGTNDSVIVMPLDNMDKSEMWSLPAPAVVDDNLSEDTVVFQELTMTEDRDQKQFESLSSPNVKRMKSCDEEDAVVPSFSFDREVPSCLDRDLKLPKFITPTLYRDLEDSIVQSPQMRKNLKRKFTEVGGVDKDLGSHIREAVKIVMPVNLVKNCSPDDDWAQIRATFMTSEIKKVLEEALRCHKDFKNDSSEVMKKAFPIWLRPKAVRCRKTKGHK